MKLPHIDEWNAGRLSAAERYNRLLADIPGLVTPFDTGFGKHVYHQYTVRVTTKPRDEMMTKLNALGIGTMIYYPVPLHKLPVYQHMQVLLPESERAAAQVFSLPIWPKITEDVQMRVADALREVLL